jgi:transketolase
MKLATHLDKNILTAEVTMTPNRNGYGTGLKEAGEQNKAIVALSADLTESTRTNVFAEAFPERFVQVGIAEQNLASVASGMAAMGKVPFIASYAMFSPGRNWEQIRTTIAYNDANVKIIGAHSGVSVGPDGATHQAVEDLAIMRVIPNMAVLAPCDVHETKKAVLWAAKYIGPVYIRISREKSPVVTTEESPFEFGRGEIFMEAKEDAEIKVGIVSTGILAHSALVAAKELNESGIGASVLHLATIKPLDTEAVLRLSQTHDFLITFEEHQVAGGLGSAVAEYLSEVNPIKIIRLGVKDQFGQSGTPEELLAHYGMDSKSIVDTVKAITQKP